MNEYFQHGPYYMVYKSTRTMIYVAFMVTYYIKVIKIVKFHFEPGQNTTVSEVGLRLTEVNDD